MFLTKTTYLLHVIVIVLINAEKKYEIKKNYVNIYTNHPYTDEVMESYRNTEFYKRPANTYTVHRSDGYYGISDLPINPYQSKNFYQSKNRYQSSLNRHQYPRSKFKDNDVLYSDFGVFEDTTKTISRKNETKNNYNFVFDDDKNLVYIEPIDDDFQKTPEITNQLEEDDRRFVYLESQKHNVPNVGVHLSKRPNFQTTKVHDQSDNDVDEIYQYKPPIIRNRKEIVDDKTKFNNLLRKYMIKLNKQNVLQMESQQQIQEVDKLPQENVMDKIDDDNDKSKFLEVPLTKLKNKTFNLANKLFSLFTIIQFPNSRCLANSVYSAYEGTCYHATECAKLNGTAMGNCAKGFGVCCVCKYFFLY